MASIKSIGLGLMAALLASGAPAQEAADTGYTPIYMLYSGDPSPARLAGLRQFLEQNRMSPSVTAETLDTVTYKLRQFKTGFAYPVYSSETATEGNACVVADNHYSTENDVAALLASSVVARHVLRGGMPALKREAVLENIMHHELFHCHDALSMSLEEVGTRIARDGAAYFAYQAESGADVYAALHYLRNGGDKQLLRQIRDFRTLNLLNGDAAHYTAREIDHILWNYDARRLQGMSTRALIALARTIRNETALTPDEFAQVMEASSQFRKTLLRAAGEAARSDADDFVSLVYDVPLESEFASQLILQVRGALHGLGGDIRSASAFHSVFNRYFLPVQFRIAYTAISH